MSALFRLRPLLLERLRAALPPTLQVAPTPSLEALLFGPAAPGVYLLYGGTKVAESRPDGRAVRLTQSWRVLIIARHVATAPGMLGAQDDAGTLADSILDSLLGWPPAPDAKPLHLVECPPIDLGEATVDVIALAFETEVVYRAPAGAD